MSRVLLITAAAISVSAGSVEAWAWFDYHQWYAVIFAVLGFGMAAFFVWRLLWDLRHRPTSKSSPLSPSPSSSQSPSPMPLLVHGPNPSVFPSLLSVTIDQPVVGFRSWQLNGTTLLPVAIGRDVPWSTTMRATCLVTDGKHSAPQPFCTCGLHAWLTARASWLQAEISGAVLASGRIYRHSAENGFRAEKMRILSFALPTIKEVVFEFCPSAPPIQIAMTAMTYTNVAPIMAPYVSTAYGPRYGHCWETADKTLSLPTTPSGVHNFKAKVRCQWCHCGPEREFTTVDHSAEIPRLEYLAAIYKVPLIPVEKITNYAAEFGTIASEVKQLTA